MDADIEQLFNISQAGICLAAAIVFYSMFRRGIPSSAVDNPESDYGNMWSAIAMAIWFMAGAMPYVFSIPIPQWERHWLRFVVSTLNNLAMWGLMMNMRAAGPMVEKVKRFLTDEGGYRWAFIFSVLIVIPSVIGFASRWDPLQQLPDTIFSVLTLAYLGYALFSSFVKRGFVWLPLLAVLTLASGQVFELLKNLDMLHIGSWNLVILLSSKTMVAFCLLALGYSSLHDILTHWKSPLSGARPDDELESEQQTLENILLVRFTGREAPRGATLGLVVEIERALTPANYRRLECLARARRNNQDGGYVSDIELGKVGAPAKSKSFHFDYHIFRRIAADLGIDRTLLLDTTRAKRCRLLIPPNKIVLVDKRETTGT